MRQGSFAIIACGLLLWAGTAQARFKPTATLVCQQSKLLAQGELEECLAQNSANMLGRRARLVCGVPANVQS